MHVMTKSEMLSISFFMACEHVNELPEAQVQAMLDYYVDELSGFAETADGLRDYLVGQNVGGFTCNSSACVLATWFQSRFNADLGAPVEISVDSSHVRVGPVTSGLPPHVGLLVRKFDTGHYPDLMWEPEARTE